MINQIISYLKSLPNLSRILDKYCEMPLIVLYHMKKK